MPASTTVVPTSGSESLSISSESGKPYSATVNQSPNDTFMAAIFRCHIARVMITTRTARNAWVALLMREMARSETWPPSSQMVPSMRNSTPGVAMSREMRFCRDINWEK